MEIKPIHIPVLCKDVFFVEGASQGAIYDFRTGNVYSINQSGCKILTHKQEDLSYWNKLIELGIAQTQDDSSMPLEYLSSIPYSPTKLKFIWFEIAGTMCNERCLHCYVESATTCKSSNHNLSNRSDKLSYVEWTSLIIDGYRLGCRQCQFIGGEPFLYRGENGEKVIDLARFSKQVGYEFIEIFTNATLLTDDKLEQIKDLGIHVAVSIYSHIAEIHDEITQIPGSFFRTMRSLEKMLKLGIPFRVAVVLMRNNQETIEDTRKSLFQMGLGGIKIDVVRPTGRGKNLIAPNEEIYKQYALTQTPNFKASKEFVVQAINENSCLAGKIVITDNGDVIPCIFGREWIIGNVRISPLESILNDSQMQKLWTFNKSLVKICRDCEYRYVCHDCRPLAQAVNKSLDAPPPRCTYNPYTGEWGKGVWRIDSDGEFSYSSLMEEKI